MSTVFMVLAATMMAAGLTSLWLSLRYVLRGGPAIARGVGDGLPERGALEAEKRSLLRAIKDIQFDRELGKISESDFERLNKAYRRRAKRVLTLLDVDLEPFVARAEQEVAEAMGELPDGPHHKGEPGSRRRKKKRASAERGSILCWSCECKNDPDATFCKACAAPLTERICHECGTRNDPDAKFCKSCAASLRGGAEDE